MVGRRRKKKKIKGGSWRRGEGEEKRKKGREGLRNCCVCKRYRGGVLERPMLVIRVRLLVVVVGGGNAGSGAPGGGNVGSGAHDGGNVGKCGW